MRPFHCTSVGLTAAIAPNVGDSGALFLSVGFLRPRKTPTTNKEQTFDPFLSFLQIFHTR